MLVSSSCRFATRLAFVRNFSSSFHSVRPSPSHRILNKRSLPPPNRISPSLVSNDLYGTIDATTISERLSRSTKLGLTMRRPPTPRVLFAAYQAAACNICQSRRLAVAESDIDVLTLARLDPG